MSKSNIKSFDEVMKSIKKENYDELRKTCEGLDGIEKERVDAIIEMIKFDEDFKITKNSKKLTKVEEDGELIYKCDKPTYIDKSNETHFDTIKIEASDVVKVVSNFDTDNLELKNYENMPLHGRMVFDNKQTIETLNIKDTAVRGIFKTSKVSVDGMTYLDLYFDAKDECKHTELSIRPNDEESYRDSLFTDEKGKNIRGSINLSVRFYNKLSKENKIKLLEDGNHCSVHILIEGIPIYIYNTIKYQKIDIEVARKQLMRYKKEYGKALSNDVEFEVR